MKRLALNLLVLVTGASAAHAGGLYIPGYGSQAQPRAGAFTAKADDPSALFHNPAGLARQQGTALHVGFNLVNFDQTFQREGVYEQDPLGAHPWDGQPFPEVKDQSKPAVGIGGFAAIPLLAVATDLGLDLPVTFGAGILAAHGYPFRDYAPDYVFEDPNTPPPPQRYDNMSQEAVAVHITAGAAYSINDKIHVGATVAWGIAELKAVKYVWGVRNYEEAVAADGFVDVDVKDTFVPGFGLGVLWEASPMFEVGASYRSASKISAKGRVISQLGTGVGLGGEPDVIVPDENVLCQEGGTAAAVRGCLDLTLPQSATIGGRWILRDGTRERMDVELDVKWEDWSAGSDFEGVVDGQSQLLGRRLEDVVTRHGFRDTFSFRLGLGYNQPIGANTLSVRAGAAYDTAAAPLSFTRVDLDGMARTTLGLGAGFEVGRYRIDVGGGAVIEGERVVPVCNPDVANPGCSGTGMDLPVDERTAPDPEQPLQGPLNQVESPYNGGTYNQSYILLSLGLTARF